MSVDVTQLPEKAREDMLVSVGFIEVLPTQDSFAVLKNLSQRLSKHFRYWEILVIADAEEIEGLAPLFDAVPNLRLLKVRAGISLYRRRFVLASQAIGDVLAITKGSEVAALNLVAMIETSINEASVAGSTSRPAICRRQSTPGRCWTCWQPELTGIWRFGLRPAMPRSKSTKRWLPTNRCLNVGGYGTWGGVSL